MFKNSQIENVIFIVSFVILLLITPDFIGIGLSNFCIMINLGVLGYISLMGGAVYNFYKGKEFSPGIQMYKIKSLKEDGSNFNIWHRRIGVVVRVLLALIVLIGVFKQIWCMNQ